MNILHIDTEKIWRGGQQQVLYLHEALCKKEINSILVCNKSSVLAQKCIEKNLPFYELKIIGEVDIFAAYKIASICKKKNIDIIHSHSAHAISIGILVKFFFSKIKLIAVKRVDFHISKNILSRLKYNNSKINKIVSISEFIKKVLIEDGIDSSRIKTIRSGVNIRKYENENIDESFLQSLGINKNNIILGTVAAFVGHKDYPTLIKAFAKVKSEVPNLQLCLVGDGVLLNEIKQLAYNLKVDKDIIFTGFRNDIGKILKCLNIYIIASKKEGLGTSTIDAMAIGLPIIATSAGGIPEIIEHEINGILVPPQNHLELADAIIVLINNPDKQKELSENTLKSIEKFSIEKTVEENIMLYKELLGSEN